MAALNKEYNIVIKLYTIAKDFDLPVEPEEYALYQTLSPSFQHLKVTFLSHHRRFQKFAKSKKCCLLSVITCCIVTFPCDNTLTTVGITQWIIP